MNFPKTAILTGLFLKLDYRDKSKGTLTKLFGISFAYIVYSTLISMDYYRSYDLLSFMTLGLTLKMFLIGFAVLGDFSNLLFSKQYSEILETYPFGSSELVFSKIVSTFLYLLYFGILMMIPQSVFVYISSNDISIVLKYFLNGLLFDIFILSVLIFLYSIAINLIAEKSSVLLFIFQISFVALIMYLSGRTRVSSVKNSIFDNSVYHYLPQSIFSKAVFDLNFFLSGLVLTILFTLINYFYLRKNYNLIFSKLLNIKSGKQKVNYYRSVLFLYEKITSWFLNNAVEKATFVLMKNMFLKSKTVKLKMIPTLFIPLVFIAIGIIKNKPEGLLMESSDFGFFSPFAVNILSPGITITYIMSIRLLISNIKIADETLSDIRWIYELLPMKNSRASFNGAVKFIYLNFIFPLSVFSIIILSFKISTVDLIINYVFIFSTGNLFNLFLRKFDCDFPFSVESTKLNSTGRVLEVFFAVILGILIFGMQIFIFGNVVYILISLIVIFGASFVINNYINNEPRKPATT
jgi:hypothetical protein